MSYAAFYVGLTGLKAHSSALGAIGNNLSNVNTIGYKSSRAGFADIFTAANLVINEAGLSNQIGLGTRLSSVQQIFNQGALQPTEVVTDLAVQGHGFFVLSKPNEGEVYSRAGNFSFDAEGFMVAQTGHRVQGFTERDTSGNIIPSGAITDIQVPTGLVAPPEATTFFRARLNLDAGALPDDLSAPGTVDPEEFSTSVTVIDSIGDEHELTIVFTPEDVDSDGFADQWSWEARVPAADVTTAPAPGQNYVVVDSGLMTFDGQGQLVAPADETITLANWANGADPQDVAWEILDDDGNAVITSFAAQSVVDDLNKDGFTLGRIRALSIDEDGILAGIFSNGQTRELAQLAMASVNNPAGMLRTGGNLYATSIGSGPAAIGVANTGARGAMVSRALELANVDVTEQFTDLIVIERGYQANSRIITTTDSVIQEALSIKR